MNLPLHIVSAGIGGIIASRFLGALNAIGLFCSAAFLDFDHYLHYILKFRNLDIGKAFKYFYAGRDVERLCLCIFHTVEFTAVLGLISYILRSQFLLACFLGVILHYAVDLSQALYLKRLHYRWWSAIAYYWFRLAQNK